MSSIRKSRKQFTQVSNVVLRDENISLKAKGLFAFMDSKPDGWNFTIKSISDQVKDGQDSVNAALKELRDAGYIKYYKLSNGHGIYELIDNPNQENPDQENPDQENPKLGKPRRISNTEPKRNTYLSNTPLPTKSTAGKQQSKHSDIGFRVIVQTLRDSIQQKSKIKNSDEEYKAYLQISDTSTLIDDYKAHISAKGEYAKNFLNFMLDYNPKTLKEQVLDGEVRLWA